jgi:hypothetical protein
MLNYEAVKHAKMKKLSSLLVSSALLMGLLSSGGTAFACSGGCKVSTGLASTINYGASESVQILLSSPIIAPMPSGPGYVTANFTSSDPARLSITPSSVTFAASTWSQPQYITVQESPTVTYGGGEVVTVSETTVSNALYYNGFSSSGLITLQDTPPPVPVVVNQQVQVTNNGSSTTVNALAGATGSPDPSTLSIITPPIHGTAVDPPGTITYTPDPGYVGSDSLVFQVCSSIDSAACTQGTLTFLDALPLAPIPGNSSGLTPDTGLVGQNPQLPLGAMLAFLGVSFMLIGAALIGTKRPKLFR